MSDQFAEIFGAEEEAADAPPGSNGTGAPAAVPSASGTVSREPAFIPPNDDNSETTVATSTGASSTPQISAANDNDPAQDTEADAPEVDFDTSVVTQDEIEVESSDEEEASLPQPANDNTIEAQETDVPFPATGTNN